MQFLQLEALKIWQYLGNNVQSFCFCGQRLSEMSLACGYSDFKKGIINLRFFLQQRKILGFPSSTFEKELLKSKLSN